MNKKIEKVVKKVELKKTDTKKRYVCTRTHASILHTGYLPIHLIHNNDK